MDSKNHVRKVALIGGSGQVGSHILSNLLQTSKHDITVLTRPESTSFFPESPKLSVKKVDLNSRNDLVNALRGHDCLIITLHARAPPALHESIIDAAEEAGVPRIMPNYFGFGLSSDGRGGSFVSDPLLASFGGFIKDAQAHEATGPKWTGLVCGFWYGFSLTMGPEWFGFDIPARKVTFYTESASVPHPRMNTSTWEQCGRAIASFLSQPLQSQDGKPGIENWDNKGLYVSSFCLSQRDMLNSLHRVLGTKDEDWTIGYQAAEERYAEGMKQLQGGDMMGFAKALYARMFFKGEEAKYEDGGLDNEVLGLPVEDLDEATRKAVEAMGKK